jgi:hypothetical protein
VNGKRFQLFIGLVALPLAANTISDVTNSVFLTLNPGDALHYSVPAWNFRRNASALGLPESPTALGFRFVTAAGANGIFEVQLTSGDGAVVLPMRSLVEFDPGALGQAGRARGVSMLQGSFTFTEQLSEELFAGRGATLTLRNAGAATTVGLAPFTLGQDLYVTLQGAGLMTGAPQGAVQYEDPPPPAVAPEPGTAALVAGAAAALAGYAAMRKRVRRV